MYLVKLWHVPELAGTVEHLALLLVTRFILHHQGIIIDTHPALHGRIDAKGYEALPRGMP